MAALHSRLAVAIVVALALGLFAACDPKKTTPKPTTGASGAMSEVMPRTDGPASAPR
jgi:hypothetical protein